MTFKSEQGKLQKKGFNKESAGKILGAAAQKAKSPSPKQKKVLRAQGKKRTPARKGAAGGAARKSAPPWADKKGA
jgi:hypothetical protein